MKIIKTELDGCFIIEPCVFGDGRGWFYESYSAKRFSEAGLTVDFVQDNRSYSAQKDTLRGLHCQSAPRAQSKLIYCTRGAVRDVAVDIRKGSASYMKWISVELSSDNKKMFFIPKGFLHGFVTLTDDTEVFYKVDEFYSPENDKSIRFDDPSLGIDWRVKSPVLSEKDRTAPLLADSGVMFDY
ncbi:MAG: dTDP-4-dehydrorhamnose 3,5-epimerase [Clostridiales bacterium]|jgi:dTDP-4-dehydrorhamnose 3,5-epimerase|nr:dTDP-4-dehydrorhamnose 3,5-epimerase [Clostridiales bacterium]